MINSCQTVFKLANAFGPVSLNNEPVLLEAALVLLGGPDSLVNNAVADLVSVSSALDVRASVLIH